MVKPRCDPVKCCSHPQNVTRDRIFLKAQHRKENVYCLYCMTVETGKLQILLSYLINLINCFTYKNSEAQANRIG